MSVKKSVLDWQNIDTVLLDLDGTLLDLHFDNYFWLEHLPKRWAEKMDKPEHECRSYLHSEFQRMCGSLNWYCLDYWSERLQMDMVELKREITTKIKTRPEAKKFLNFLSDLGKQKILVTNGHRDGMNLKFAYTEIAECFDEVVSCHDFGVPKEEQNFWVQLQKLHAFDKKRTLFIDDNESVLDSAQQYGISHLLQILKPDLQRPSSLPGRFLAIEHFSEILN